MPLQKVSTCTWPRRSQSLWLMSSSTCSHLLRTWSSRKRESQQTSARLLSCALTDTGFTTTAYRGTIHLGVTPQPASKWRACGYDLYSIKGSNYTNDGLHQSNCTSCPKFAECDGAASVSVSPGHWCQKKESYILHLPRRVLQR